MITPRRVTPEDGDSEGDDFEGRIGISSDPRAFHDCDACARVYEYKYRHF